MVFQCFFLECIVQFLVCHDSQNLCQTVGEFFLLSLVSMLDGLKYLHLFLYMLPYHSLMSNSLKVP